MLRGNPEILLLPAPDSPIDKTRLRLFEPRELIAFVVDDVPKTETEEKGRSEVNIWEDSL